MAIHSKRLSADELRNLKSPHRWLEENGFDISRHIDMSWDPDDGSAVYTQDVPDEIPATDPTGLTGLGRDLVSGVTAALRVAEEHGIDVDLITLKVGETVFAVVTPRTAMIPEAAVAALAARPEPYAALSPATIGFTEAEVPLEELRRKCALELAVKLADSYGSRCPSGAAIGMARDFEQYLAGDDLQKAAAKAA